MNVLAGTGLAPGLAGLGWAEPGSGAGGGFPARVRWLRLLAATWLCLLFNVLLPE